MDTNSKLDLIASNRRKGEIDGAESRQVPVDGTVTERRSTGEHTAAAPGPDCMGTSHHAEKFCDMIGTDFDVN